MLSQLTYRQFVEWVAYFSEEGFTDQKEDMRNAMLVTAVLKIGGFTIDPATLIPRYWKQVEAETPEAKQEKLIAQLDILKIALSTVKH